MPCVSLDPEIKERLLAAIADATSWYHVYKHLREQLSEDDEDHDRALIWAFRYDLVSPEETDRLAREGSVFGAMFEFGDGRMPPRLADVPNDEVAVWVEAFDAVEDPRLRSRVGDLLWSRKVQPHAHLRGQAACKALVELSHVEEWEPMETTEGLGRALDLARELSDEELTAAVAERMVEVVDAELGREDRPGIPFRLLRALLYLRPPQRPGELLGLVRRAANVYAADPHNVESAIELEVALAKSAEGRTTLRHRQAELWRASAGEAEGIIKLSFLDKALDIARTHGLAELARDLRVELQSLTDEDLDLKPISAEVEIDRGKLDALHGGFMQFDTWQESLMAFGSYGPPTGEPDGVERQVERHMRDFPMQFLFSQVVIDPDLGLPIFRASDEESHKQAALARNRWIGTRFWASSAVTVLQQFTVRYGRPSHDELTEFLNSLLIDAGMAERVALAFELWWDDRPDESAHLLVPRIETAVRNLAREVGLPIGSEPYGGKHGKLRSLGELLHQLGGRFPTEGWRIYLLHLLVDPLGLNLRNVIAHGVRARIERGDAALLLHAIAFLRMLEPQQNEPEA